MADSRPVSEEYRAQGQSPISKLVPVRPNPTKGEALQTSQALLRCSTRTEIAQFGGTMFRFWDGWVSICSAVEVLCRQVYRIHRLWSCNLLELVHSRLNHRCSILLPSPGSLNVLSAFVFSSLHVGQLPWTHVALQESVRKIWLNVVYVERLTQRVLFAVF